MGQPLTVDALLAKANQPYGVPRMNMTREALMPQATRRIQRAWEEIDVLMAQGALSLATL